MEINVVDENNELVANVKIDGDEISVILKEGYKIAEEGACVTVRN